jgi:hypothetical protein
MDPTYQGLHDTAKELHNHVRDAFDNPGHPSAQALAMETKELITDFELQRNPRDIEERIKNTMALLHQAGHEGQPFMSVNDALNYYNRFQDMQQTIKGHEHYS